MPESKLRQMNSLPAPLRKLMENAGTAQQVLLIINDAGKALIRDYVNGKGMSEANAQVLNVIPSTKIQDV